MHQIEEYEEVGREGGREEFGWRQWTRWREREKGGGEERRGEEERRRGWLVFNGVEAAIELCVPFCPP